MAGYTRQSTFADGDTITAALFNNEYNQLLNAFNSLTGHKHDGTTGEGAVIALIGDTGVATPLNKVLIDTTNDHIEFWVDVSSSSVQQLYIADGAIIPVTDSDIDLGTTSLRFKDTYTDTVTTTGNVSIGGDLTVTGSATISGNLTFGDADTDSINLAAEIDSHIVPNTDDTYDLGTTTKEWRNLYIDGTANIDSLVADTADINGGTIDGATIATSDITVGAGKTLNVSAGTLTLADNQISGDKVEGGTIAATTITTLTSTTGNITNVNATTVDSTNLEVTNLKAKDGTAAGSIADSTGVVTLASSVLTTTDINGGTIDGVTIGGSSAGAVTFTDLSDGTITIAGFADEDNMVSNSATLLPTQQSVKAYVDSQVTAQDLDFQGDTGGALSIDLDSESLTIAGGTGIDTSGATNTLTVAIDSTVATLTGTQTLTNKTLTSPDINTPDIDGGTIDATTIGGTTPAAGSFTTLSSNSGITGTLQTAAQPNITSVGTLTSLTSSSNITVSNSSGYGSIELGGSSGGFIDLKTPASDDFDARIIYEGSTLQLLTNADEAILLKHNSSTKLATSSTGVAVTGTLSATGDITGTLATAAQPNITSLGTLTALTGGTGDLNWDSGTLFVDSSANAVGIGTTSPSFKTDLNVSSTSASDTQVALRIKSTTTANMTDGFGVTQLFSVQDSSGSNFNIAQLRVVRDGADDSGAFVFAPYTTGTASEAMRIDSSGNVGIGTASPDRELELSAANPRFRITDTDGGYAEISGNTGHLSLQADLGNTQAGSRVTFDIDGSEKMRIDSSGNVGIGTTSPLGTLHVNGDIIADASANNGFGFERSGVAYSMLEFSATAADELSLFNKVNNDLVFGTNSTERARILNNGNFGLGTDSPDTIMEIVGADPILTIRDTATGQTTANSRIRFAESASGDILDNYWDVGLEPIQGLTFSKNGTEHARFDNAGNFGIGTDSPDGNLHVLSGSAGTITAATDANELVLEASTNVGMSLLCANTSVARIKFGDADSNQSGTIFFNHTNDKLGFQIAGSNIMTLDSSGIDITGNATFDDSGKAIFGAGSDLQIYHNGSNSFIDEVGTGRLYIRAADNLTFSNADTTKTYANFENGGAAKLYYNNALSILTTTEGAEIREALTVGSSNNNLGTTAGDQLTPLTLRSDTANSDFLLFTTERLSNGSDWTTAAHKIQRKVDATKMGYMQFGSGGSDLVTFGEGSTEYVRIDGSGQLGVGTDTPLAKFHSKKDGTGQIIALFSSDLGTNDRNMGILSPASDSTTAPFEFSTSNSFQFTIDGGAALNIAADKSVVIGGTAALGSATFTVDSDSAAISVFDSSAANGGYLQFRNNNTAKGVLGFGSNAGASSTNDMILGSNSGNVEFHANNTEAMRINTSGDVIIGKTTSTDNNEAGLYMIQSGAIVATRSSDTAALFNRTTNDGAVVLLRRQNVNVGSITVTGSATAYNTSSDYRLKENVNYDFNALDRVAQLKPARFNFIADADTTVDGFLAHEVSDIVPEAIHGEKDAVDSAGNPEYQGIDQSKLVPLLTKAIQEQQTIIDDLKSRIETLEG